MLTSSAYKQDIKQGRKHLHGRTDGTYEEVTHLREMSNCFVTRAISTQKFPLMEGKTSMDVTTTITGNLTADPELRFIPSGAAVANFTIAHTPRTFDKQSGEWKDGEPLFMRCSLWREAAENATESLTRGMRVIATGKLKQRSFEKDGASRTVIEMDVEEIGPSMKYATAVVTKSSRGGDGGKKRQAVSAGTAHDPWAAQPDTDSEPPF